MEFTTFSSTEKNEHTNSLFVSGKIFFTYKRNQDIGRWRKTEFVTNSSTPKRMATGSSLSRKEYNKIRNLGTSASKKEYGKQTCG